MANKFFEPLAWWLKNLRHRATARRTQKRQTPAGETQPGNLDQQLITTLANRKKVTLNQLKHVGKVMTPRERRQVRLLVALAAAAGAFLGVRWILRHVVAVPIAKGSYTEGVVGAPQFINPLLSQTNDVDADIASLIYSGLFRYDAALNVVADLAEQYRVSDDGLTYVVTLRSDGLWHDGVAVTADDVVFTYSLAQDLRFKSPLAWSLGGVKVQKTGEREVTFQLPQPYDGFLGLLTTGLLPEHRWGEIPPIHSRLTEYNLERPIGSGPWRFKTFSKERRGNIHSYTLTPFVDSRRPPPYLQELTFRFFPDSKAAVTALNGRAVDGISYLAKDDQELLRDAQVQRYDLKLPQYTAIFFNQQSNALLGDKNVRQALAAAIDREIILTEALKLRGETVDGPLLPGAPGFDPELKAQAYDPVAAEQLLESAGWKLTHAAAGGAATSTATSTPPLASDTAAAGERYRRNAAGLTLALTLTTVRLAENVTAAELIAEFWRAIGVKVNVTVVPPERIIREIVKPRNYQALLYGEAVGTDPDPYPFWHSSQIADPGLNLAIFANRHVDQLLEEARAARDGAAKAAKYREFAQLINAEIPAIFLYTPRYIYAQHTKIKGFNVTQVNLPQDRLINLPEWYVATGWRWR